jgi:hypothetical protein
VNLSLEHIIPGELSGKREVLTCTPCNNNQGSAIDSHFVQHQKIAAALKGHGTLATELKINDNKLVANLEWNPENKNFKVVGKASNPKASELIQADFKGGNVSEVNFSIGFGYSKRGFELAVLRAGYLVLFKRYGYQLIKEHNFDQFRRCICDSNSETPDLSSIVISINDFMPRREQRHFVIPASVNGVEYLLVIIRAKLKGTAFVNYFGVFFPDPNQEVSAFFAEMERLKQQGNGATFQFPPGSLLY